jgi:predicted DNA-binding transcriptional regulator YafY
MLYNDEETRKEQNRFLEQLKAVRSFTEKDAKLFIEQTKVLLDAMQSLANQPELTEEEAALLVEIQKNVPVILEKIKAAQSVLGESILRQSNAYYQHVKKLAEEGDVDAKKIYEDLHPHYQNMLKEQMRESSN